ncbi:MAG: phosphopyruvate hydratase [Patescibacteria group bacterium]
MSSKKFSINKIFAREILDSRGNPTLEVTVDLKGGITAKAGVPSGASTGSHEAVELRDGDKKRYGGKGVLRACANVAKIGARLKGMDAREQERLDATMLVLDGTPLKSRLGANTTIGVSFACARAAAHAQGIELFQHLRKLYLKKTADTRNVEMSICRYVERLPIPMFNIFNGGAHADNNLDVQEIMVVPLLGKSAKERVRIGAAVFHALGAALKERGHDTDVGNEGGYAPNVNSVMEAFDLVLAGISRAGYRPGKEVAMALDIASSSFFDERNHHYRFKIDENYFTADQMISLYHDWIRKYPLMSLEDPLAEDDFEGWARLTHEFSAFTERSVSGRVLKFRASLPHFRPLIIGDDLLTTNVTRLERAAVMGSCTGVIVKPNQIGTLTEALTFARRAEWCGFPRIASHRSGETNDDALVDFAVAIGAEYLKAGAPSRGERVAKYNRLMEIEGKLC